MGKKSGPSAPAPPDPYKTAAAQGAMNKETAQEQAKLNRINEYTPYGSLTYRGTGSSAAPYSRTTKLSPQQQGLLDAQSSAETKMAQLGGTILDRVAPDLATPFSLEGAPEAAVANDETRQRVEQALYDRMAPQFEQDEESLRTRLANTGFDMNSEGYAGAMDQMTRAKNDARLAAIAQGGAEMGNLFGLQQATRNNYINEQALERSQPLNEIAAILGTGQVNSPNFGATPQVGIAAPDLMGATYANYQGEMNNFNQAQQNKSSALGGLFGMAGSLGGAAIKAGMFSDRRLKSNIKQIGTWRGYPAYIYEIFGKPAVGVMSDEVNPDAVLKHSSGFDMVDYSRVR